eukprot:TRINITY_DN5653_c0_g1_i1.p1 TRINITY_DN5653_c0_g1~~TRINITY_DN5653_c0_g1_i1.p1  ORF type:complete len:349 (+),score=60.44 TRINITY_DN5653_c0_g1_i1:37-1047(+)
MVHLICLCALLILCCSGIYSARPNFIIFNPDEMRAESLGCYGNKLSVTPNFDKFASQGVRFEQCHTTYPECVPSRSSFLTGWYPHVNGHRSQWHMLRNNRGNNSNTDYEPNLFRYLKNAGYNVQWYGKNDALSADSFATSVTNWVNLGTVVPLPNIPFNDPLFYSFLFNVSSGTLEANKDYQNLNAAINFLKSKPQDPFTIFLPMNYPHPPYTFFQPYYDMVDPSKVDYLRPSDLPNKPDYHALIRKYRRLDQLSNATNAAVMQKIQAVYLGLISFEDFLFGKLLQTLQETGYENNTTVFVMSDHGDYAGDYGLVEKWPSGLEDVLTRVPMLIRYH